ncbi:hypothetical protein [Paraburkholderia sp. BR14374]
MEQLYKLELRDDNGNVSTFHANDWESIEILGELLKAAASTTGY